MLSDDRRLVHTTLALFESIWQNDDTRRITATALKNAKEAYDRRPQPEGSPQGTTLLAACQRDPKLAERVFVAAYKTGLGPIGKQRLATVRKGAAPPTVTLAATDFRRAWGYQYGEKLPDNSWIVDLCCMGARPIVYGCSQVKGLYLKADDESDLMITTRGVVNSTNGQKFRISSEEKRRLIRVSKSLLNEDSFVPMAKVLRFMNGKRGRAARIRVR